MAYDSFLVGFENVLWNIALALLISGGIFVFVSVFLNIENFLHAFGIGDHDVAVDHDVSVDHDIAVDHDVSVDHDIAVDHDVSVDHDIAVDHDVSVDHDIAVDHDVSVDHEVTLEKDLDSSISSTTVDHTDLSDVTSSSAPIFLILSTYFLMFGILGVTTLKLEATELYVRILRIIAVIITPYLLALIISKIWRKISSTTSIPVKKGIVLIGHSAQVYVPVDSRGGIIHVNLGEGMGTQKLNAKSFNYYDRFEREESVRIVAFKDKVYLVDK